ncbi:hydantoinase B/oxoprolinase family protein [Neoroseomonas oryzicola]|uniref:Hydantoinase B/oxoprolinase family protein n=1 Tax=Neoroseomonas oryzicola TaxID=535904 RepID=A0A9X9WC32_9PROT|nr:hydantoinase B/oxoprolinase family protein [Neoroseomonas oryzicola]MBR0657892.1 hydantoinase B/oxoprolinase family protein [Neoroseomonas oryzicola]NKE18790.1 hydantoinase B/oxoprolinase family protein [Neoroseomonas oryzicola]
MTLGPIEIEVIRNALTAAAAEMDITIWRTSRSTIVRELLDYSTAVFDAEGNNVAQSARIPQHLNSMGAALRTLLDRFVNAEEWGENDVVATNDPYCGAQHLNDVLVFKPVMHEGKRVAYVGALCHHIDMGGMAPGSYAATATEVFQEGIRIPPLKLIEDGRLNRAVWEMIGQNVRKPALMLGDLQSQLASLEVGAASIRRLAQRYGAEGLLEATARILDMSEAAMRAAIRAMPDGRYEFEDFLDEDGVSGDPVRLHAVLTVTGEEIEVDLTGCADQQRGPINCTPAMSNCAVYYSIIAATDGAMPANAGCYRPIRITHRDGSVTSCRAPASVAHRVAVSHRLANVMFGCLHQALPDRMPAAYYGGSYVATFQTEAEDGGREVLVEIEIGGTGANPAKDGVNAWSFGMHNNANIPVEMIESQMPLTITRYGLLPGSGGAGKHRGGLGLFREWRLDSPAGVFTANMDRFRFPPYGLAGGRPGSLGRLVRIRDGAETPIAPKSDGVRLLKGDIVRLETSGGGGFGDPAARDPAEVARDRTLGYVS